MVDPTPGLCTPKVHTAVKTKKKEATWKEEKLIDMTHIKKTMGKRCQQFAAAL
jgi:hypothetical protein